MKITQLKLIVAGTLSAFLLAGCGAKDNTPPPTKLVKFKSSLSVKTLYNVSANDGSGKQYLSFAPALSKSLIVTVSHKGEVTAMNKTTGDQLWERNLDSTISSSATINNGHVYVGTLDGWLYALDAGNGKIVWKSDLTSSLLSAPAAVGSSVVVHTHDGAVSAFDAATGKNRWVHDGLTPSLTLEGNSSPVIVGKNVLVGFDNGQLASFKISNGQFNWERPVAIPSGGTDVAQMVDIIGTPKINNDTAYVGSYNGNLISAAVSDGHLYWQQPLSTYRSVFVTPNKIVATTSAGHVEAFNRQTGLNDWTQDAFAWRFTSAPAVIGQYVVVGDYAGYVHWLSLSDGHQVAQEKVGSSAIRSQPVISGHTVYLTTADGRLIALQPGA